MTPGYRLKFERAAGHFREARKLLHDYLKGEPYTMRRDEDTATGLTFWFTLKAEPPEDIALAIGDCVHNLRAALDHIVYELSCHYQKKAHVRETAFPVYASAKDWDDKDSKGKLKTTSGLHKLRAIPPPALTWIEELQPFKGLEPMYWPRERLLQVHRLDIADKHRSLNLAVANLRDMAVYYGHDGPALPVIHVQRGRLTAGTEVPLLRFAPSVDPTTPLEPSLHLEVLFADPTPLNRGPEGKPGPMAGVTDWPGRIRRTPDLGCRRGVAGARAVLLKR